MTCRRFAKPCAFPAKTGFAYLAFVVCASSPALACSCKPISRAAAMAAVNTVFEGRVLKLRREGATLYADIEMARMLKGTAPRIVEVGTPASSAACGYPFKVGERVTVAAQFAQQQYTANFCTMMPLNPKR